MKKIILSFLIAHFAFLILQVGVAQIIHVPAGQPTIQAGINAANDGDTVLVADGMYLENINFMGKAITVASHFIMDADTNHMNNTVIDGNQQGPVVTFITEEDTTSVLCGFTITGGTGMTEPTYGARIGGGIVCYYATAKIIHNKITGNVITSPTDAWGGGIFSMNQTNNSWIIISGNTITGNRCNAGTGSAEGGGMEIVGAARICDNIVSNNQCTCSSNIADGGGIFHMTICTPPDTLILLRNLVINNTLDASIRTRGGGVFIYFPHCIVRSNTIHGNVTAASTTNGGGMLIREAASSEITGNMISSNFASSGAGGGLAMVDGFLTTTSIYGNTFRFNSANFGGGFYARSCYNMTLSNNIMDGNESESGGALGLYTPASSEDSRPAFLNNTIINNQASLLGGAAHLECETNPPVFFNCIFYSNSAPTANDINHAGGTDPINVSYCDINQANIAGRWTGEWNFNADPGFIPGDDLYHLSLTSPCKNAGTSSLEVDDTVYYAPLDDYEGEGRPDPQYLIFDVGSDERWDTPPAPVALDPDTVGEDFFIARWQPVALATGYRLDVASDANFSQMVPGYDDLDVGDVTEFLVSGLEALTYYYRVRAYNALNTSQNSNVIIVLGVGIEADAVKSSEFKVQSFPNPFSNYTTISFNLPEELEVTLKLYDLTGREVRSMVSGYCEKGEHTFILQAEELNSGVYIFRLTANREPGFPLSREWTANCKLVVQ